MTHLIKAALEAAKATIQIDRTSLADTSMRPDNTMEPDGAQGVAEYDAVLAQIDAGLAALPEPVGFDTFKAKADEVFGWVVGIGGYEDALRALYTRAQLARSPAEQTEIERLKAELADMEAQRDEALRAPWPEWAEKIKARVRESSGYDGYDDQDGIDLPQEVNEHLSEIERQNERLREQIAAIRGEQQTMPEPTPASPAAERAEDMAVGKIVRFFNDTEALVEFNGPFLLAGANLYTRTQHARSSVKSALDEFERRERGIPQAHMAAQLVAELRTLMQGQPARGQPQEVRVCIKIQGGEDYSATGEWMGEDIGYLVCVPREWQAFQSAPEPMTDEQIDKLRWGPHEGNPITFAEGLRDFARAVEAHHGITAQAGEKQG